jgi:hypothetical protein
LPTKRRFRGRHRREDFGEGKRSHLCHGQDFFGDGYGKKSPDRGEMFADWRAHGAAIVDEWIRERPGTRPWAFWEFETLPGSPRLAEPGFVRVNKKVVPERDYLRDAGLLRPEEG